MTTPKEKIQAMIATAKKAGEGDFREKAINSQTFYEMANPTAFITLAESLLACLEALDNIAGAKLRVDPTPNVETCHASQTLANVTKKLESL